jgi:hypothetical protein
VIDAVIFTNTAIALHVSFLVTAQPGAQPCSLRRMLVTTMECIDLNRQQADWLARLVGQPGENVDFSGLSRTEIRGQCGLVTQAVEQRLPPPELFAVLARYAQTMPQKSAGIHGLVEYVAPFSPTGNREALTDLVWRRYLPTCYRGGFSLRDIEKRTHVGKSTLGRVASWLDADLDGLELQAFRRLEQTFVPHGVCGAMSMAV